MEDKYGICSFIFFLIEVNLLPSVDKVQVNGNISEIYKLPKTSTLRFCDLGYKSGMEIICLGIVGLCNKN